MESKSPTAMKSLKRRDSPLAQAGEQLRILNAAPPERSFEHFLSEKGMDSLCADGIEIMQVNVGKLCNMTCRHCHVDAGPDRREIMTRETIDHCLNALCASDIKTLDLTGGAPEMNPDFRYFVSEARKRGVHVIDRCNLTILLANGYEGMAEFLAENEVEIVASLPCYLETNTDQQRGDGAYRQSIEALRMLNTLGYGKQDTSRNLTLVYNPVGSSLPPNQQTLEDDYRKVLRQEHDIEFTRLFTITNMPISRFLDELVDQGEYEAYMQKLIDAFNPAAVAGVMCRKMISVGWDGLLYDCDFNQMLELPTAPESELKSAQTTNGDARHIRDFDAKSLGNRSIVVGQHCFGCTAAAGSGCLGAIES